MRHSHLSQAGSFDRRPFQGLFSTYKASEETFKQNPTCPLPGVVDALRLKLQSYALNAPL
jgi:hypothetical protein